MKSSVGSPERFAQAERAVLGRRPSCCDLVALGIGSPHSFLQHLRSLTPHSECAPSLAHAHGAPYVASSPTQVWSSAPAPLSLL